MISDIKAFNIEMSDFNQLWYPKIYIGNSLKFKSQDSFGPNPKSLNLVWYYYYIHKLKYSEVFITSLSCKLDFKTFPFDSQDCVISLKNWYGASYRLVLNQPTIYTVDKGSLHMQSLICNT